MGRYQKGFTLPELIVTIVVFTIVAVSTYSLFVNYVKLSTLAQMKSIAVEVASSEMEFIRSVAYNNLAVQGGSIVTSGAYLEPVKQVTRSLRTFTVVTDIRYVDDAFDGCFSYSTTALRDEYCRNSPPEPSKPVDNNPKDYKVVQVTVKDKASGQSLATISSYFAARVAEVASNTGLISVKVTDMSGAGVSGATVRVQNNTVSPVIDQTLTTDDMGTALFMDVTPDSGKDYVVTASKAGYNTLSTIAASGALIPTYPNVSAIAQNMTNATLMINPISSASLDIHVVTPGGLPVAGAQVVMRGGTKLYTNTTDTTYSYSATLPMDSNGFTRIGSLVPGSYSVLSVTGKYIVAIHTAIGATPFQPFDIPPGSAPVSGMATMQSIYVVVSTSSVYPRVTTVSPISASSADQNINGVTVSISGVNLAGATVKLIGKVSGASITGSITPVADQAEIIIRDFNLQSAPQEAYRLEVSTANGTAVQDSVNPSTSGAFHVGP